MNTFSPKTGSPSEWNEAYYRLEDYLRAHQVGDRLHQSQLILPIVTAAAARHEQHPQQNPTVLVMEEAFRAIDFWFQKVYPKQDTTPARLSNMGKVAMSIIDAPAVWPKVFLTDPVPGDFGHEMQRTSVQAGPNLQISSMVPRSPDPEPATEPMDDRWEVLGKISVAMLIALGTVVSLGLLFYLR